MNRRAMILLLAGLMVLALSGIAAAAHSGGHAVTPPRGKSAQAPKSGDANEPAENEQEGEGVHGGTIERTHADCPLPDGATLSGNWTHGDYVSAWAKSDPTTAKDAAQSSCGKPAAAVAHSAEKGKSGQAHGPPSNVPAPQPPVHS